MRYQRIANRGTWGGRKTGKQINKQAGEQSGNKQAEKRSAKSGGMTKKKQRRTMKGGNTNLKKKYRDKISQGVRHGADVHQHNTLTATGILRSPAGAWLSLRYAPAASAASSPLPSQSWGLSYHPPPIWICATHANINTCEWVPALLALPPPPFCRVDLRGVMGGGSVWGTGRVRVGMSLSGTLSYFHPGSGNLNGLNGVSARVRLPVDKEPAS